MYISLKWIQNIINLRNLTLDKLCERLTLAGFEIEEIIQKKVLNELDFILDVSLTANRSDIFNIKGFSAELLAIFFEEEEFQINKANEYNFVKTSIIKAKSLSMSNQIWENFIQKKNFSFEKKYGENFASFDSCFTFLSFSMDKLKVQTSQGWLKKCLLSSNFEPKNNIEDTLQLVCLETGYPFFCFDRVKLQTYLNTSSFSFSVRKAESNQKIVIDKENILFLDSNNLLLYVNNIPISIIGLLTIKDIEVDKNTTEIIVYSGLFDPVKIRKSSQVLGIRTENSVSLQKILNFNGLEQAYIRLCFLLKAQNISIKTQIKPSIHYLTCQDNSSFINYIENKRPKLQLRYKEIQKTLSSSIIIKKEKILSILKSLDFHVLHEDEEGCELYVPFSREMDLEREVDLIEEIVRVNGFTKFNSITPRIDNIGKLSKLEKLKRLFRKLLIEKGLNETLHYSVYSLSSSDQLELKNPIVPESSFFRTSLIPQLIQKAALNKKQKNQVFEAFEVARVYSIHKNNIFESELISGIFGGNPYFSIWNDEGKAINWFEAKGLVNSLFDSLNVQINWVKNTENSFMHPGRTALLLVNNQRLGFFGQIHPILAKTNGLADTTFLFELNLDVLKKYSSTKQRRRYKQYSLFPASFIDLACIKKDSISYNEVKMKIRDVGGSLLESIDLFDYYAGVPIPSGYHSIGFKLKFRDPAKTLTNNEVDALVKNITKSLEDSFKIQIRK